jgi:benzoyl-CoA reductase/2-hydroxyglutaryl-CoA dehydratase subunit BcrC/BadD/HgdB
MNLAESYIQYVNQKAQKEPDKGWEKILLGFRLNNIRTHFLPKKQLSRGYQKLEDMMMTLVSRSLSHPDSYVWGNIFAPCEIMHAFGLNMLSIECLSCYLSGFHLEDFFIDYAQSIGLAPTLCSYHKTFVGAVESGVVKAPKYAVTTSLSCDGNLNTFRFFEKEKGVPFTLLDVPYTDDELSVDYLAGQLEEMVGHMERTLGLSFDEEALKESIRIENKTQQALVRLGELMCKHYYPGEIICQLYLMMGTHLLMGTKQFLELIEFMIEDIQTYPLFTGKRILWVHLLPFYQESLKQYFGCNEKYQIMASDMILDYTEPLNPDEPYRALAKKLIRNVFNGSYERKATEIGRLADRIHPDAVINFCHWGCKQAAGGSMLMKEEMKKKNIPMLNLDGDGIDKRNSHDGQIKTRLEAFLEMIEEDGQ